MQKLVLLQTPPVTPIQFLRIAEAERGGDGARVECGDDEQEVVGHHVAQALEKCLGEVALLAADLVGVLVEVVELLPHGWRDGVSAETCELDAGAAHSLAFLAQVLALAGVEGGEEVAEGFVASVVPVELAGDARAQACLGEVFALLLAGEEYVPGAGADASGFCDDGVGDGVGNVRVVLAFGNK